MSEYRNPRFDTLDYDLLFNAVLDDHRKEFVMIMVRDGMSKSKSWANPKTLYNMAMEKFKKSEGLYEKQRRGNDQLRE